MAVILKEERPLPLHVPGLRRVAVSVVQLAGVVRPPEAVLVGESKQWALRG